MYVQALINAIQHIVSIRKTANAFIAFVFLFMSLAASSQKPLGEYNVKAAFLYNFAQFVEWPSNAIDNNKPFIIGILGDDPFRSFIDQTVAGENVKGRSILVQRYQTVQEIGDCHILFISASEALKIKDILAALPNRNILTVSDIPEFAKTGGMIRFMTQNKKIRLQINPSAAKAANLNISSKLLRLAEIIGI